MLVGAGLTAIIQSSSASVGILQALSVTGGVSYAAAIPIIMGQNIGTCVTAMLSSVGTNKNARRAAVVHLMFNVIGVVVLLTLFCIVKAIFAPAILDRPATMYGIAIAHSVFNILCTAMLLPAGNLLEKLAIRLVPDAQRREETSELDARLLATPALALGQSRNVAGEMAACAVRALENALTSLTGYTPELARSIREDEERCDHYEDIIGTYLVQLSSHSLSDSESQESTELLKTIGDFERISDHAVNVLESAEELQSKGLSFSPAAMAEYETLARAIREILHLSLDSFRQNDAARAARVEPLEQVIDKLKEEMRTRHILRMRQGQCSIEAGFVRRQGAYQNCGLSLHAVEDRHDHAARCGNVVAEGGFRRAVHQAVFIDIGHVVIEPFVPAHVDEGQLRPPPSGVYRHVFGHSDRGDLLCQHSVEIPAREAIAVLDRLVFAQVDLRVIRSINIRDAAAAVGLEFQNIGRGSVERRNVLPLLMSADGAGALHDAPYLCGRLVDHDPFAEGVRLHRDRDSLAQV